MKKISIVGWIVLVVIAGIVVIAVSRKPQSAVAVEAPPQEKVEKPRADLQEAALPPEQMLSAVQEISPLQPKVAPVRIEPPKVKPVEMNDEEFRAIVESFEVTSVMKNLLDSGDEVAAVFEARNFLDHPNREVRLETVRSLEWIGLPAAMELAKMIDDHDTEIRDLAQDAFWQALDEAEDPYLKRNLMAEALQSNDPEIRARIIEGAVFIPDVLSFGLLAFAMDDPDPEVAALARENITFVSGEEFASRAAAEAWFKANQDDLEQVE